MDNTAFPYTHYKRIQHTADSFLRVRTSVSSHRSILARERSQVRRRRTQSALRPLGFQQCVAFAVDIGRARAHRVLTNRDVCRLAGSTTSPLPGNHGLPWVSTFSTAEAAPICLPAHGTYEVESRHRRPLHATGSCRAPAFRLALHFPLAGGECSPSLNRAGCTACYDPEKRWRDIADVR